MPHALLDLGLADNEDTMREIDHARHNKEHDCCCNPQACKICTLTVQLEVTWRASQHALALHDTAPFAMSCLGEHSAA